jgi:hypothetical protein
VKKVLRYLQGTKGLMFTYRRSDSLQIEGYSDSDYAGEERKSMSGYIFTLAGGAISWKSSKQTVTTSSTMYAEFVACYEATGQVNWLKKFIPGLKVIDNINEPLRLYCDNNPAVQYAHNNRSSGAAKHIDIKYYVVKDKVRDHIINLEHISIERQTQTRLGCCWHRRRAAARDRRRCRFHRTCIGFVSPTICYHNHSYTQ